MAQHLAMVGNTDQFDMACAEYEEALLLEKDAKRQTKIAKETVILEADRAGLESVIIILGEKGVIISARRKPTAADGPLLSALRDEGEH